MTPGALLREALAAARASLVPTVLVALVVAATCLAAVTTVGRQAAAESALAQQLAGAEARTLTVTATGDGDVLTPAVLDVVTRMKGADSVIATDLPVDAVNGRLGQGSTPIAVTGLHGTVTKAITITRGRLPGNGEVVVAQSALARLGLEEPVGYLQSSSGQQWSIVGSFEPRAPFGDLANVAVAIPSAGSDDTVSGASFHQIRVVADSVGHVAALQHAVLAVLAADPTQVQVTSALAAATTSLQATSTLAGLGRSLLLLILGAGAFFVAAVVLADVLIHRRDLGRRRTLGIGRSELVALVAVRTGFPALVGALAGATAGGAFVWRGAGEAPASFAVGVAILGVLTTVVACLPPAAWAAGRDPVEVMRMP